MDFFELCMMATNALGGRATAGTGAGKGPVDVAAVACCGREGEEENGRVDCLALWRKRFLLLCCRFLFAILEKNGRITFQCLFAERVELLSFED